MKPASGYQMGRAFIWTIRRWIDHVGRLRWFAVVMLIAAAIFVHVGIAPLQDQVDQTQLTATQTAHEPVSSPTQNDETIRARESERLKFVLSPEHFPPMIELPAILSRLYEAALPRSLSLLQGEYRKSNDKVATHEGLQQVDIFFPVKGSYTNIRDYVSDVLVANPSLSLRHIRISKDNILNPLVDAELHFSLYLRQGS